MQVPTHEKPGIAFARDSADLHDAVDAAIQKLHANGEFARLQSRWLVARRRLHARTAHLNGILEHYCGLPQPVEWTWSNDNELTPAA
jgi:hypothetical protein